MTAIVWDEVGSRTFQTGVSHGILFLPEGGAVPWNGLTGVGEEAAGAPSSYYQDGMKYLDRQNFADYSAKVTAFTYPDELDRLVGTATYGTGLKVHGQRAKRFGFSYRTDVGNDVGGAGVGYRIHLVYNALATPSAQSFDTVDSNVSPIEFEWQLDTKPLRLPGYRPTASFVIDTTEVDPEVVQEVENMLYGTPTTTPSMPDADDLLAIFGDGPKPDPEVVDGAWTMSGDDRWFTITEGGTAFSVRGVRTTHADENEYTMESH